MRAQLAELVELYEPEAVTVVDVGGDAVASGTEDRLRSPLADALTLAAAADLHPAITLAVAGPGLDGELSEQQVLAALGPAAPVQTLDLPDIEPFRSVLEWHPSEGTALLAAAARGLRGKVEVRDVGLVVDLTSHSPAVYRLPVDQALAINELAAALTDSSSLVEAEDIARKVCGFSEIDYERAKQAALAAAPPPDRRGLEQLDDDVRAFERDAASRGIVYVTFRRIAEAISVPANQTDQLRRHLTTARPGQYVWPLWSIAEPGS